MRSERGTWLPAGIRTALDVVAPSLTLLGLVLFVILRSYYNRFYGALSIDPATVGLTYASTFVTSLGVMVFLIIAAIVFPIVVIASVYVLRQLSAYDTESFVSLARLCLRDLRTWLPGAARAVIPIGTLVALTATGVFLWHKAGVYSEAVSHGRPIKFGNLFVTSFSVRATPVEIAPIQALISTPNRGSGCQVTR